MESFPPRCLSVPALATVRADAWACDYACGVLDTTSLITAVDRFADRLRSMPQSALLRGAAAGGRSLAGELARRAQRLESPGRAPFALPDAGPFVAGDQVAVAGHDLAEALAVSGTAEELAEAVALVETAAAAAAPGAPAGSGRATARR